MKLKKIKNGKINCLMNFGAMKMSVKFVSYTGKWPCLCMGVLTVKIDDKEYKFGHEVDSYDFKNHCYIDGNYSDFWRSGGGIRGTEEGFLVAVEDDWLLDDEEHQDYPEWLKETLPELIKLFNENVEHGCCGGCI